MKLIQLSTIASLAIFATAPGVSAASLRATRTLDSKQDTNDDEQARRSLYVKHHNNNYQYQYYPDESDNWYENEGEDNEDWPSRFYFPNQFGNRPGNAYRNAAPRGHGSSGNQCIDYGHGHSHDGPDCSGLPKGAYGHGGTCLGNSMCCWTGSECRGY